MSEFGNPSREKVEPLTTQWYEYVDENNRLFEIVRIVDVRSVVDGSEESKILTQARRIEYERFQSILQQMKMKSNIKAMNDMMKLGKQMYTS